MYSLSYWLLTSNAILCITGRTHQVSCTINPVTSDIILKHQQGIFSAQLVPGSTFRWLFNQSKVMNAGF